ncbi:MAG: polymorphic toxin-type HINT domain-containing protein [Pseudonocardiaceae bacterium]
MSEPTFEVLAPARRKLRWRRRKMIFGCLGLVVVLLIAGLTVWLLRPKPNTAPFDQAVANLAAAPAVHYKSSLSGGSTTADVVVTSYGDSLGIISRSGSQYGMLAIGEELYLKAPDGFLPDVETNLPVSVLKGKWVTGSSWLANSVAQWPPSPSVLAGYFRDALAKTTDFPSTDDPDISIDGITALQASTPAGDLYVTSDAPYRVLRYVPHDSTTTFSAPNFSSLSPLSGPSVSSVKGFLAQGDDASSEPDSPSGELDEMDFDPMSSVDVDHAYDELERNLEQLSDAVDIDRRPTLQGDPRLVCGPGGCTVTIDVTTGQTSRLTVALIGTFSVEGQPAGSCTSNAALPPGGGVISCVNPGAGPVFAAIHERKRAAAQAEADAKAAAQRGRSIIVPFETRSFVETIIYGTPQVDVEQEARRLREQRAEANCTSAPNSFVAGTRVLLADGSTRPIEDITAGTEVRATDPLSGQTTNAPVLAKITGHGQRQLDEVTVSNGQHIGRIVTTGNHPFWVLDQQSWVAASELRIGQRLIGDEGDAVEVTGLRAYSDIVTVYNIAVVGIHTYYVGEDGTRVLVHNCTEYSNSYGTNNRGIIASVDSAGILNLAIESGPGTPNGAAMLAEAMQAIGGAGKLNGIRGTWGIRMPDNLASFNAGIQNLLSPEQAALYTFTGKMATQYGFSRVNIERLVGVPGEYTYVNVVFRR